ncbi:MAG: acyltransferase [Phycisphaerae bacterium]|nr:acyltransferase [Gemmatimonadaceae bacterium]
MTATTLASNHMASEAPENQGVATIKPPRKQVVLVGVARGLAALAIVPYHVLVTVHGTNIWMGPYEIGVGALPIFFVLTGFVLTYVHGGEIQSAWNRQTRPEQFSVLRRFFIKRFMRLYPTYWMVSAAVLAAALFLPGAMGSEKFQLAHIVQSFAAWPVSDTLPILPQGWTLPHDIKFYLLFGALYIVPRRYMTVAGIVLIAGVLVNGGYRMQAQVAGTPTGPYLVDFVFHPFLLQFIWGVLIARALQTTAQWPHATSLLLGGIAAYGLVYVADIARLMPHYDVRMHAYGIGAGLLLFGLATYDVEKQPSVPSGLVALGDASYSVYITHIPVIVLTTRILRGVAGPTVPLATAPWVLVQVGVCLIVGFSFYYIVEAPLHRYMSKRLLPRAATP